MEKQNYYISPVTEYDEEQERWATKVGIKAKNIMTLHYTVWGNTKENSRSKAISLAEILSNQKSPADATTTVSG